MALQSELDVSEKTWKAYDQWIEVNADRASYQAASPENALVLIGPNRKPSGNNFSQLKPIGLLQNFTIGQTINWQAQQMIGSGRTFFLAGKSPGNGSISRLFTSQSTLLGAIYKQALELVGDAASQFESLAYEENENIQFTLDSELFKIPIGLCALFRDTTRKFIGGFYVENMVIPSLSLGFSVGQPAIFESVSILFDRVVPFDKRPVVMNDDISTSFDAAVSNPLA